MSNVITLPLPPHQHVFRSRTLLGLPGPGMVCECGATLPVARTLTASEEVRALREALASLRELRNMDRLAIRRAQALHRPTPDHPHLCPVCADEYGSPLRWPCPTVFALNESTAPVALGEPSC